MRLIGPIPRSYCPPSEGEPYAHPGGPAPQFGGYRPVPYAAPLAWLSPEFRELAERGRLYRAHTTDTALVLCPDGWYVAAPDRPTRRAVTIAADMLRVLGEIPGGLLPEEEEQARACFEAGVQSHRWPLPWEPVEPWAHNPQPPPEPSEYVARR